MLHLALYQPEIPHNTGTLLRLGACLGVHIDIIEPCGFIWNHPSLKRSGMDYLEKVSYARFRDFEEFLETYQKTHRIIAVAPQGKTSFYDFHFQKDDILLMGRESDGLPQEILEKLDSITIPMTGDVRSLNLAISAAIVITEALRQTK
jgi:tRNA (cytidine/uridine-2'-O-)-methyltransferase